MFLPCPNCGFLVALVKPKNSATEQRCPRCGHALAGVAVGNAQTASAAPASSAAAPGAAEAGTETAPDSQTPAAPPARRSPSPPAGMPDDGGLRAHPGHGHAGHAVAAAEHGHLAAGASSARARSDAEAPPVHAQTPALPPAAAGRRAPSFARRRARAASRPPRWPLYAASATLALVLALQLVLAQRAALAADARWRPMVEALCGVLGCSVPAWREPGAFTMLDRSVQPKPGTAGVLDARAHFRNDARWPQSWPTLVLTLSGVDGEPLGARAFTPAEYAGRPDALLAPGETARVQLDVVEPGPGVVAFAFDFR